METPRPRCLYKIAHTEKNEHHWLLVRTGVRSQKKRQRPLCSFFSFLSYRRPGLCTAAAFFFYFRAIGEAACLRHRLMFASRNADASSSSTLFFNLTTIHPLSSFTFTISDFSSSPLFPPSLARNTSGPSRLSCYEKLRSSFLINALWNRAELKVSLKSMHTYIYTDPSGVSE